MEIQHCHYRHIKVIDRRRAGDDRTDPPELPEGHKAQCIAPMRMTHDSGNTGRHDDFLCLHSRSIFSLQVDFVLGVEQDEPVATGTAAGDTAMATQQ